uniref:Uncharacterized protein n=1 Tax=Aegilops tauschii subsp. strangulata TaxID=200361 RepID=A0A453P8X6_AEGTS
GGRFPPHDLVPRAQVRAGGGVEREVRGRLPRPLGEPSLQVPPPGAPARRRRRGAARIAAATARVDVVSAPCWMPSPARFASSSAAPRTGHHIVTTKPSSMRIWWVADLMRWMSRAKRRSASKQEANDGSSAKQPQPDAALVDLDPEEEDRKAAFERMDNLGRCIADVENSGESVFRALVNTRVSLLNILSPSF